MHACRWWDKCTSSWGRQHLSSLLIPGIQTSQMSPPRAQPENKPITSSLGNTSSRLRQTLSAVQESVHGSGDGLSSLAETAAGNTIVATTPVKDALPSGAAEGVRVDLEAAPTDSYTSSDHETAAQWASFGHAWNALVRPFNFSAGFVYSLTA